MNIDLYIIILFALIGLGLVAGAILRRDRLKKDAEALGGKDD